MNRFQHLEIKDLKPNPFDQFSDWFEDAKKHISLYPEVMSLSSIDKEGYPESRYVLLRGFKPPVFQFYTNYNSDKGQELLQNPKSNLLFFWKELGRQVRIVGQVTQSSKEDSDIYWKTRPHESQIHALSSNQSSEVKNFSEFLDIVESNKQKFENKIVPRPLHWGGFDFTALRFEFWQEGEYRLHHRFVYSQNNDKTWDIKRLYP